MKVLFIGLGGIGQRHLRNLFKIYTKEDLEIYAYRIRKKNFVLDDTLSIIPNEDLNIRYNITNVLTIEEALEKNMDKIFICNPSSLHIETLIPLLKYKADIFLEKPISNSLINIKEVLTLIEKYKTNIQVGYQFRFHPCILKAKEIIDSKILGNIISVNVEIGENIKNWHKYENYKDMYASKNSLGGGVILTQIHELDYLYYLFGMPNSLYAIGAHYSDLEIDVEDSVNTIISYNNFSAIVHQDYLQEPARRYCTIIGNNGKLEFDLLSSTLKLYVNGQVIEDTNFNFQRNNMFLDELKYFLNSSSTNNKINFYEGLQSLYIAIAIKESIQTKEIVRIKGE